MASTTTNSHRYGKHPSAKNVELDLSLLTDGLRAEREQGITIDVAYRYFSTPRRKFIIADAPGHEQYTRNMATGASTAELAMILVDARKGVLRQTRRHTLICFADGHSADDRRRQQNGPWLTSIRTPSFPFANNSSISPRSLPGIDLHLCPLSALDGDNVIRPATACRGTTGQSLLQLLETLAGAPARDGGLRFPIQSVIRPNQDFRGYAGQVGSGTIQPGQEVMALPSRQRTTVKEILLYDKKLDEAVPGQSVVVTTADHIDLSRGDMLVPGCRTADLRQASRHIWSGCRTPRCVRTLDTW